MNYNVRYGKTEIRFDLDRRNRKTLAIHVYPDKHVEVIAPEDASIDKIMEKVRKRSSWIYKQQLKFDRIQPAQPKPKYNNGETFRYLGKQYRLKVFNGPPEVKLKNGRFHLSTPEDFTIEKKEKLLLDWYKEKGRQIFYERMQKCVNSFSVIEVINIPELKVKTMPKRWGSCTKEGRIYLNPELVAAPKPCIDYVIFHELCHIIEHNHSLRFFKLLTKVYPDWKRWRDYLNENIEVRLI
ncbi:MAG: SprT family zinc-dependent metalloprotease [Spirochaetales bacterium]|uniref:SprT family zinc-dependent metalloprotease n=1 Tax=Candidatus Thalassospirochaeta sargassi TaxID=3119039 RepID=A0AAJ1ID34_9SPIO|nr:SprT family zinc-dependent metalloprotease [Spirochaetales bacterium]